MTMKSLVGILTGESLLMLALALLISAGGFRRVVYFVSLGFAFSIAAMAMASLWIFRESLSILTFLHCLLLLIYGLRLGIFLARRELKPVYKRELEDAAERASDITGSLKLVIWLGVSLLYVALFSSCLFNLDVQRTTGLTPNPLLLTFGVLFMAAGMGMEALADYQKSAYKERHPDRFCDEGLYRWVRCPNYLGEIIFWSGNFLAGFGGYTHWLRWLIALAGLICIVLIMLGSTKRLERKQDERYGAREDYERYRTTVPVLFPFVPVYTLKNVKVYLE
jgi:steroid 5-alpha reductase family enzyme